MTGGGGGGVTAGAYGLLRARGTGLAVVCGVLLEREGGRGVIGISYTHLRAHDTVLELV